MPAQKYISKVWQWHFRVHPPNIFAILLVFSFRIAMLSIFGNVPCTLKTLPNIISHYDFSLIYFSLSIPIPSIFGNAHWILKTAPQISSQMVNTIPLFLINFPYFIGFFSFSIATHSIFGNAQCTLKALPNIITNSGHHPLFFSCEISPILSLFFICKSTHFYIWKCTLDPENSAQCCHQQWAPLLSSPMHSIALPDRCTKRTSFFAGTRTHLEHIYEPWLLVM